MHHVFVETNWVVDYASPAHHKDPDAVGLLGRARAGELRLHVPSVCLTEARNPIMKNCQPRHEAGAIREFLKWATSTGRISAEKHRIVHEVLARFEQQVKGELAQLDRDLVALSGSHGLEVFPLNEAMLRRSTELALLDLQLGPFDQCILAAVLVRAEELWAAGERELSFCELDADLQPWDKQAHAKQPLTRLFGEARVWVYEDFLLNKPNRPPDWPDPN